MHSEEISPKQTPLEPDVAPNMGPKSPKMADMDDIFNAIKPFGRYQIFLSILYLCVMCPLAINNNFMGFGDTPKFVCKDDLDTSNTSLTPTTDCKVFYNCSPGNLTFEVEFYSIADQWALVCDNAYYVSLITSIQMIGDLIGAFVIGYISDTYGRKPTFLVILAIQLTLGCLSSLSPSWPVFAVFRFFIGCCAGAELVAAWVLVAECTTNRYRYLVRALAAATLIHFDSVLVGYFTKNWMWYSIVGNLQGVPIWALFLFFTHESPRWLAQKGRLDEAHKILKKIASLNGTLDRLPEKLEVQTSGKRKPRPWLLFRMRKLSLYTVVCISTWFVISTVNYGMSYNIGYLPANIYVSTTILGCVGLLELPIAFYDAYNPHLNRRWILLPAFVVTIGANVGVILSLTLASPSSFAHYDILVSTISIIGQISANVVFDQAYMYAAELFPTLLRSTAVSLCGVGARVGMIIAPQVLYLRVSWAAAPYVFFAILGFIGLVIDSLFLPNTKNKHLPEVPEDLKADEDH